MLMEVFAILLLLTDICVCLDKRIAYMSFEMSIQDVLKGYTNNGHVTTEKKMDAINAMKAAVKRFQKHAFDILQANPKKFKFESSWVTNSLIIEDADEGIISKLENLKGWTETKVFVGLVQTKYSTAAKGGKNNAASGNSQKYPEKAKNFAVNVEGKSPKSPSIQWNIQQIRAHEVWNMGFRGQGITLGLISNGAYPDHPLVKGKYRGDNNYGFYEPEGHKGLHEHIDVTSPQYKGFPTLRVGQAVADGGYGVAPDAQFMVCSAVNLDYRVDACVRWMICPHNGGNDTGDDEDCSKAPNAVLISGENGGIVSDSQMIKFVDTLVAMGITVISEAGTNYDSAEINLCQQIWRSCLPSSGICVGFSNFEKQRSRHSRCGPYPSKKEIKPDLIVPGINVTAPGLCPACFFTDNIGQTSGSGQALGVIGLLLSKNRTLRPDQIKQILINASRGVEDESYLCCNSLDEDDRPNFCQGYGLLDAKLAIEGTPTI